jgi:membrane protein YqaA with SNARE-associated domain
MSHPRAQREDRRENRIERWARHPAGPLLLGLFAALEACLFPAPTEPLLAALSLARPRRTWHFAAIALGGSLLGSLIGYTMGYRAHGSLEWAAGTVGAERIEAMGHRYRAGAFWVLATSGFTPIPYLVYTIAGGVYGVPLLPFVTGALVGRGLKYLLVGFLARALRPYLRQALARPALLIGTLLLALAIAYLVLR